MNKSIISPAPDHQFSLPTLGKVSGRRTYAPGLAVFLSRVRLEEQLGGEHPYGYASNNPVVYTDPSGRAPNEWTPPWLGPDGPNRSKILNCLSTAIKNNSNCQATGKSNAELYAIMRCIIGCENRNEPGRTNPWTPDYDPDKLPKKIPLPREKAGIGPCRIHGPAWPELERGYPGWDNQLCVNVQLGVSILCQNGEVNRHLWGTYSNPVERARCYTPCIDAIGPPKGNRSPKSPK